MSKKVDKRVCQGLYKRLKWSIIPGEAWGTAHALGCVPLPRGMYFCRTRRLAPLSTLVYRSRARVPLSELELLYLLAQARGRNRAERITGLLVYDQGVFYQWIEGPDASMIRLWQSIRQDARHYAIEILSEQQIPVRLFRDWHLQLAFREGCLGRAIDGLVEAPSDVLDQLHERPRDAPAILSEFTMLGGGPFARVLG